jgi:hypothetical protein
LNSLQSLSRNFALDIARIDKLKSKTAEGTRGYLHLCNERHALILKVIADLKPIVAMRELWTR